MAYILFEDGELNSKSLKSFFSNLIFDFDFTYTIVDAKKGISYCKTILENFKNLDVFIYTNSLLALDSKYHWNYDKNTPQVSLKDTDDIWKPLFLFTKRELKSTYNFPKLYLAGEFNEIN